MLKRLDKNIPQLSEQMKTNYVSVVISFGIIENGLKEWKENGGKKMHLIAFYKSKNDTFSLVKVFIHYTKLSLEFKGKKLCKMNPNLLQSAKAITIIEKVQKPKSRQRLI